MWESWQPNLWPRKTHGINVQLKRIPQLNLNWSHQNPRAQSVYLIKEYCQSRRRHCTSAPLEELFANGNYRFYTHWLEDINPTQSGTAFIPNIRDNSGWHRPFDNYVYIVSSCPNRQIGCCHLANEVKLCNGPLCTETDRSTASHNQ